MTSSPSEIPSSSNEANSLLQEIERSQSLLDEGKTKIISNQKDAVFVIGMAGSGKTTLVKFLTATNNDDLQSVAVANNLGEYIIKDSQNKINNDNVIPKTIFPELYRDVETGIAIYDNPGFGNPRLAVEIASTYYLRRVIQQSEKIRFILTVNFSSVRRGVDRSDFLDLLKNTLHLVKNIDKYADSIAMVVTKVDTQMMKKNDEILLVPDEIVLESIANFLTDFRNNISKVVEGVMAENMLKLIDTLLLKNGTTYKRIALFKRPDEAGPISDMKLLQDGKVAIKKLIRDNLKAVPPQAGDIGLALSEGSKNKLHDVLSQINENIAKQVEQVCKLKIQIYESEAREITDVYGMHDLIRSDFEKLRDWVANLSHKMDLNEFVNQLMTVSQSTIAPFTNAEKERILAHGKFISFIETVDEKKSSDSALVWKSGLETYLTYLRDTIKWYKFLSDLKDVLSSYEVQKKVNLFSNVHKHRITNWHDTDFVALLEYCKTLTKQLDDYQSFKLDNTKIDQLNGVFKLTLLPTLSVSYDKVLGTVEIRGTFIKLSEIKDIKRIWEYKYVNIFAVEKLFIDVDLKRSEETLQGISMVAPTWQIVGDVQITLDGMNGCCKATRRAPDGDRFHQNGYDGAPGVPGKSAANFFGAAHNIINGEHLKIVANGGRGSAGQDGGKGADGEDGDSPIKEHNGSCYSNNVQRFAYRRMGGYVRRVYCVYGEAGSDGGAGANGGVGGAGGRAGKIRVLTFDQSPKIRVEATDGAAGEPGAGGVGGSGGTAGRSWNHQKMLWWWKAASCSNSQRLANEYGHCAADDYLRNGRPGARGMSGTNNGGKQSASPTAGIDSATVAAHYRDFLQQNVENDFVHRLAKLKFLVEIEEMIGSHGKSSAKLRSPTKGVHRNGRARRSIGLDRLDHPNLAHKDCFRGPEWPITKGIAYEKSTTESTFISQSALDFPVADTLLLADLLIRKLGKSKPNYLKNCAVDYTKVRLCALEMVSMFEKILNSDEDSAIDFDPILKMEKLEKAIINGSRNTIGKILINLIEKQSPERQTELFRRLQDALGTKVTA